MQKQAIDGVEVTRSSGNVFADLGLHDAEKLKIKSGLVIEIRKAMRLQGLTQQEAAKRMGITQPKVSDMSWRWSDQRNTSARTRNRCASRLATALLTSRRPCRMSDTRLCGAQSLRSSCRRPCWSMRKRSTSAGGASGIGAA